MSKEKEFYVIKRGEKTVNSLVAVLLVGSYLIGS
jgi:hypothetical protein